MSDKKVTKNKIKAEFCLPIADKKLKGKLPISSLMQIEAELKKTLIDISIQASMKNFSITEVVTIIAIAVDDHNESEIITLIDNHEGGLMSIITMVTEMLVIVLQGDDSTGKLVKIAKEAKE